MHHEKELLSPKITHKYVKRIVIFFTVQGAVLE